RGHLEQRLVLPRKAIDACGKNCRDGCGYADRAGLSRQPVGAALADQHARLDQGADALLEKERVALRTLCENPLERLEPGFVSQQGPEKLIDVGWWQRIDPEGPVVGLTAPGVPVLGPVVDEQEEPCGGQALD